MAFLYVGLGVLYIATHTLHQLRLFNIAIQTEGRNILLGKDTEVI